MLNTHSARLRRRIEGNYGKVPEVYYHSGDMDYISAYHTYQRQRNQHWTVDDTTWNDLDMDDIFRRLNLGMSSSGEQYLYYMLRTPALCAEEYEKRRRMTAVMEAHPHERAAIQMILCDLGCPRRADLCSPFAPASHSGARFILFLTLALLLLVCAAAIFFLPAMWIPAALIAVCNIIVHEVTLRKIQHDFDTVNYSVKLIHAFAKMRRLGFRALDCEVTEGYDALDRLSSVMKTGMVTSKTGNDLVDMVFSLLLIDLIVYEFLKSRLSMHNTDIAAVSEAVGFIDAAICIASYRASEDGGVCTAPKIDFHAESAYATMTQIVHPCLQNPVPNDFCTNTAMLITGSNASGKSTYLRAVAICAILAQSIGTCPCASYCASAFRIYSSMTISDNLASGDSCYLAEIKSLRRITMASAENTPMLCVIDEVLRGTNTVERVAASTEILAALASPAVLCAAATHDIELCALLQKKYEMRHFEERVENGKMTFDYQIKEGEATTRNAIKLLKIMGFSEKLTQNAEARAAHYLKTGIWK